MVDLIEIVWAAFSQRRCSQSRHQKHSEPSDFLFLFLFRSDNSHMKRPGYNSTYFFRGGFLCFLSFLVSFSYVVMGAFMRWKVEYDNDTGPNDEGFCEWWIVTNGDWSFKCSDDVSANWLCETLNAACFYTP